MTTDATPSSSVMVALSLLFVETPKRFVFSAPFLTAVLIPAAEAIAVSAFVNEITGLSVLCLITYAVLELYSVVEYVPVLPALSVAVITILIELLSANEVVAICVLNVYSEPKSTSFEDVLLPLI